MSIQAEDRIENAPVRIYGKEGACRGRRAGVTWPVMRRVCVGAILLPLLCSMGRAWGQEASPDNKAQCRAQVARLIAAINAADAEALRQLIYTRPDREAQRLGQAAVINCIVARRKLEEEMIRRWGADAPKALGGTSMFPDPSRDPIATAEVQVSSADAWLFLSADTTPIKLHRRNGQWRILLPAIDLLNDDLQHNPEPGSLQRIEYLRGVARSLQLVEAQVRGGKLASADATREALQRALEEAIKSQPQTPAAPPDNGK
jgi:hypothetical protein